MEDRRTAVMVVTTIFFVLASIFVALRFVSRWGIVHRIALHDHVMLLAWIIDLGFTVSICYATRKGLGLHEDDVRPSSQSALNRSEYATTVLYNPALMALKTSILIFYLTLTKGDKSFRWANYVTLFVVNAAGFALTMVNVFQCRPLSAVFHYPDVGNASCTDIVTLYLSSAPVNLITDLAIFFLPMPILTRMRLPLRQKIILVITFSFGFFTAVVDVIRVAYLQSAATSRAMSYQSPNSSHIDSVEHQDFPWYGAFTFMWSAVEVNIGIICACVPSLKPLAARVFPKMLKGTDDTTPHTGTNTATAEISTPLPSVARPAAATGRPSVIPSNPSARGKSPHSGSDNSARGAGSSAAAPEDFVDMMNFLNGPGAPDLESSTPTASGSTPQDVTTFFDFVNMKNPKSMLKMNNRESIPPVALTTVLFFLWGFAYGFLDILNTQFQDITRVSAWRSLGMHAAYYGGYMVAPLTVGRLVLTRRGFKATFITGLCIYACGTLIFWPSAVLTSFVAFTISNFIVGFGLAVLETAANPFIVLCGPLENSEVRLNFSQAIQAVGSVLSPLLAKKVLFKSVQDAASLVDVQWTYLAIALFDILLAIAFYYLPIPEASDDDLRELTDRRDANSARVAGVPVVWFTFGLGVFSQFCYVGGQEALSTAFQEFVEVLMPNSGCGPFDYLLIARTLFAVGRSLAALAQWFLKPRWILLVSYAGMLVFAILCMDIHRTGGVAMGLMLFLFESGAFSIIFATSLRGLGEHTKIGAAIMTAAISGGAFFPFPRKAAAISHGIPYSFCVVVALFAAGAIFPIYLNLVPTARKQVDPVPDEYLRRHYPRRRRHQNGVIYREKENPSLGGVLSRPRSLIDEPLPSVQLPDEVHIQDHAVSESTTPSTPPREGGIMHELAPWPHE